MSSSLNNSIRSVTDSDVIVLSIYDVINMSMFVAIMLIGVFGNLLIIHVFGWGRRTHIKRFENFLLLLAVVDLVASATIPLSFLYLTATNFKRWDFGEIGCRVIPSLLQVSISMSHGVLILISYERYHTIVKPFQDRIAKPTIAAWLCFVMLLSFAFVSPYMMTFTVYESVEYAMKTCMPADDKTHLLLLSSSLQLFRDVLSIIIMAILNQRMNHALTKQCTTNITWQRSKMSQKGRKLLRRIIIIFSCLTLPVDVFHVVVYCLLHVGVSFTHDSYAALKYINTFLNVVQTSNSMVNVFIYSRMHDMFRIECCMQAKIHRRRNNDECLTTDTEMLTINRSSSRESQFT